MTVNLPPVRAIGFRGRRDPWARGIWEGLTKAMKLALKSGAAFRKVFPGVREGRIRCSQLRLYLRIFQNTFVQKAALATTHQEVMCPLPFLALISPLAPVTKSLSPGATPQASTSVVCSSLKKKWRTEMLGMGLCWACEPHRGRKKGRNRRARDQQKQALLVGCSLLLVGQF